MVCTRASVRLKRDSWFVRVWCALTVRWSARAREEMLAAGMNTCEMARELALSSVCWAAIVAILAMCPPLLFRVFAGAVVVSFLVTGIMIAVVATYDVARHTDAWRTARAWMRAWITAKRGRVCLQIEFVE